MLTSELAFQLWQAKLKKVNAESAIAYWQSVKDCWRDRNNKEMLQEIDSVIEEEKSKLQDCEKQIEKLNMLAAFV